VRIITRAPSRALVGSQAYLGGEVAVRWRTYRCVPSNLHPWRSALGIGLRCSGEWL